MVVPASMRPSRSAICPLKQYAIFRALSVRKPVCYYCCLLRAKS